MKVFISFSQKQRPFANRLADMLKNAGHQVFDDNIISGNINASDFIRKELSTSDVVLLIFSGNSDLHLSLNVGYAVSLFTKGGHPYVIPIIIGADTVVPEYVKELSGICIESDNEFQNASEKLLRLLSDLQAKMDLENEEIHKAHDRLQKGINNHVQSVIDRLHAAERRQKIYAGILYALSALVLLISIGIAIYFLTTADLANTETEKIVIVGVVYLLISVLVVSFSKFLFTLARSFMVEAIRCSDRIHAISFGKFYIDAFEEKVTRDEVMKIFSTWNIDNGATVFRSQTSEDYDPKIHDLFGLLKKSSS